MDLRTQYERYPYPPVSALALPARGEGAALAYETGARLAFGEPRSATGRVLVVGCGTLEALVASQANPRAAEVVALDLSEASLARLGRRERLQRLARPWRRLPPIRRLRADLREWEPEGRFELILASNVLHHLPDPAGALVRLASWLAPDGLLRLVTYPRASRIWMRETSAWLRSKGLAAGQPGLRARAFSAIAELPPLHPARLCFESQPEVGTETGIVDAFLHTCENPLSPLEWAEACARAGLRLVGEAQTESSSSGFLVELVPATAALSAWERLEVMDCLLELCANPVLWLARGDGLGLGHGIGDAPAHGHGPAFRHELRAGLIRAHAILARAGVPLDDVLGALKREVGPRVSRDGRALPGLAIVDLDTTALLASAE